MKRGKEVAHRLVVQAGILVSHLEAATRKSAHETNREREAGREKEAFKWIQSEVAEQHKKSALS